MRAFIPMILLMCVGCAQFGGFDSAKLEGSYWNGDGYCPRTLELRKDGSFAYDQLTDLITIGSDGVGVFEGSWGVRGQWRFAPPDRIVMTSERSARTLEVFIRRFSGGQIAILEPELIPDILKVWTSVESVYFLRKRSEEPNKAPEPTPTSVTPRATL